MPVSLSKIMEIPSLFVTFVPTFAVNWEEGRCHFNLPGKFLKADKILRDKSGKHLHHKELS